MTNEVLASVAQYYGDKLRQFGAQPRGVDWNGEAGQFARFAQLCKVIDSSGPFSIADVGCGYGALYGYLASQASDFSYVGVDIAPTMIEAARAAYPSAGNATFVEGTLPPETVDFAVASGIFNVKLEADDNAWQAYIRQTLDQLDQVSRRGFAFNCLTSYSDEDRKRADLHYADPCELFDLCKRTYARNVALLHDYDLYEFTIIVRKPT